MQTLVIATRNAHKTQEIRAILGDGFRVLCLKDFPGAPALVEDADTFAGNAAKKAQAVARWLGKDANHGDLGEECLVLADDSGLEVDALGGAPGVHSARFAALDEDAAASATGNSPDDANNIKLLRLLMDVPIEKRSARFRCVLALVEVNPPAAMRAPQFFEGICEGRLRFEARGQGGFGYDPLFVPEGFTQSFAELGEAVKNKLSHRARALEKLRQYVMQHP